MSSQPRDIVDRLSYLKQILNEQKDSSRNKTKRINQYYQYFNNKLKTQRNAQIITKDNNELNNDEFYHDPTEIEYQDIEEEEEEEEEENEQNYSYDNENQNEYDENTEYISKFETNEIIAPIPKFTKIKSDAKTFAKLTFFRRWRRAFHAKQIQITISNKIKKYKQKDDKENSIYKPCYDPFSFKKATKTVQKESIERLSRPRNSVNNHCFPHSNPQYTPKTDEEKKNGQRRHLIRQIAIEREEKEQKTKPVSQKDLDKIIQRLFQPKQKTEKVPENPKPTISQKRQLENALRLSVPKKKEEKKEEEEIQKKTNRFILPTKKEQLDICTRLSQPKPDFSPKPIRQKPTITQAEQMEICERLSGIKKGVAKKKKVEIKEEEVFKKKKTHKKSKKRGRKNRKKKIKSTQNDESLTFLSNKQVVLPTASPVPTQNLPASPLIINTPRKVRFNGFQSTPKEKQGKNSRILSKEVDEAIGEINENDSRSSTPFQNKTQHEFSSTQLSDDDIQHNQNSVQISPLFKVTPTSKNEQQKNRPHRAVRRASYTPTRHLQCLKEQHNLASDDTDLNQKTTKKNVYHSLADYRRKSIQENTNFSSRDEYEKYSREGVRSSEDEQIQVKDSILEDKNESEVHISNIDSKEEIILTSQNSCNEKDAQKEEETNKNEQIIQIFEEEEDEIELKINQKEETKQTDSSIIKIQIDKENNNLFEEEEEDQLQTQSTSLLKSSHNENDDDEFNQEKFYFESPRSNEFQFEENNNEKGTHIIDNDDDDDEIVHDSSRFALKGQKGFSSEIESETIKEIDKTDFDQFVKDNLLVITKDEEEDENDEVVINDNISGIEAHTPINGLISNSGFEINLLSNTQDSNSS